MKAVSVELAAGLAPTVEAASVAVAAAVAAVVEAAGVAVRGNIRNTAWFE